MRVCDPAVALLREAESLQQQLDDLQQDPIEIENTPLVTLVGELSLLELLAAQPANLQPALLVFRAASPKEAPALHQISKAFHACLDQVWGASALTLFESSPDEEILLRQIFGEQVSQIQALFVRGINLARMFPHADAGVQIHHADGPFGLVLINFIAVDSEQQARALAAKMKDEIKTLAADSFGAITQSVTRGKTWLDHRTGLIIPAQPSPEEFRTAFLANLPLPAEIATAIGDT